MRTNRHVLTSVCILVISALFIFVSPVFAQDEVFPTEQPTQTTGQDQAAGGLVNPASTNNPDFAEDTAQMGIDPTPTSQAEADTQNVPEAIQTPVPEHVSSNDDTPKTVPTDTSQPPMESLISDKGNTTDTLSDIVTALDDANVLLATASGEPLPLTTNETINLVATGDPYFKVGNNTYQFLLPGGTCDPLKLEKTCFISSTPIQEALNYMVSHNLTPSDRKLYIESGTYNEYIELDGSKNGVKGLRGLVGMGLTPDDVVINGGIVIKNFKKGFSLTNLSVTNTIDTNFTAIYADDIHGTLALTDVKAQASEANSNGITLTTTAHGVKIILNRVVSNGNGHLGALIGNTYGETKISNSTFDNNGANIDFCYEWACSDYREFYGGLTILSWHTIILENVSANDNKGTGAWIVGTTVNIKDSVFSYNQNDHLDTSFPYGDGLVVDGVTANLDNIQADHNFRDGIRSGSRSITGNLLHTDRNTEDGVFVDTCWDNPDTFERECTNLNPGYFNITNSSSSFNELNGFSFMPKGIAVMRNIVAEGNGIDGVYFESRGDLKTKISLNSLELIRNGGGLEMSVTASITINNISMYKNDGMGLEINNGTSSPLVITNSAQKNNESWGNFSYGYFIITLGPVSIDNLDSYNNGDGGGYILSRGLVTLTNIHANGNGGIGFFIDNRAEGSSKGITLQSGKGKGNDFQRNQSAGLLIRTNGAVTITNIYSWRNGMNGLDGGYGVDIENIDGNGGVTIKQSGRWEVVGNTAEGNTFSNNHSGGLKINTSGAVSITFIHTDDNGGDGIQILSEQGTGPVTVKGISGVSPNVNMNLGNGIRIHTNKGIFLTNINSSKNVGFGGSLINDIGIGAVSLNDVHFDRNDRGLEINSSGSITWINGTANENYQFGAFINNNVISASIGKSVSLTNVVTNNNGGTGNFINSKGAVTFTNVNSSNNNGDGSRISTEGIINIIAPKNKTVCYCLNRDTGLYLQGGQKVSLTRVSANNNGWLDPITNTPITIGFGILILNDNPTLRGQVDLSDISASRNTLDGTSVITSGLVKITNLIANENSNFGLRIDQTSAPDSLKPITLNKIVASHNGLDGIFVYSVGSILVNSIASNFNLGHGAYLINNWGDFTGSVMVLNSLGRNIMTGNGQEGIRIDSNSNISVSGLETNNNLGDGIYLCNNFTVNTPGIIVSSINNQNNGGSGINAISNGGVNVNYSSSVWNAQSGIVVQTNGDVRVYHSVSTANNRSGIQVESTDGNPTLQLHDSKWFGNLRNPSPEDRNLKTIGNWNLIVS